MSSRKFIGFALLLSMSMAAAPAWAQKVTKETLEGVTNFNRLETTVACAGAIKATAVPELKKLGFASIVNLRQATEQGADLEGEAAAVAATRAVRISLRHDHALVPHILRDAVVEVVFARRPTAVIRVAAVQRVG